MIDRAPEAATLYKEAIALAAERHETVTGIRKNIGVVVGQFRGDLVAMMMTGDDEHNRTMTPIVERQLEQLEAAAEEAEIRADGLIAVAPSSTIIIPQEHAASGDTLAQVNIAAGHKVVQLVAATVLLPTDQLKGVIIHEQSHVKNDKPDREGISSMTPAQVLQEERDQIRDLVLEAAHKDTHEEVLELVESDTVTLAGNLEQKWDRTTLVAYQETAAEDARNGGGADPAHPYDAMYVRPVRAVEDVVKAQGVAMPEHDAVHTSADLIEARAAVIAASLLMTLRRRKQTRAPVPVEAALAV